MRNPILSRLIVLLAGVMSALAPAHAATNTTIASASVSLSELTQETIEMATLGDELESLEELIAEGELVAQNSSRQRPTRARTAKKAVRRADTNFAKARALAAKGQYEEASKLLFLMSRSPKYRRQSAQIKYVLGLMLFEMKLNQAAAFVFYDVIRQESRSNPKSKYLRQSLEKLAFAADSLDSEVLLKYAIKQVRENEFPAANRDMLFFRTGEIKMGEKNYAEAVRQFSRVPSNSRYYNRARYQLGLALAEAGQLEKAQTVFGGLAGMEHSGGVTDINRVGALLGQARVLYQRKQFGAAIEAYRQIPRDTEQWHEALFESSWAMLRDGRFRSVLSNFHSLHSSYYDNVYQPESLIVRAIVYLYICRYEEMEKVLDLFARVYKPVQNNMRNMLRSSTEPVAYFRELAKVRANYDELKSSKGNRAGYQVPFIVSRHILREGDVRQTFSYLDNLESERKRIETLSAAWKRAGVGQYAINLLDKRIQSTQRLIGKQARRHMIQLQNGLRSFVEQDGLLRFEMLSSKREALRKEIAGTGIERAQVDQDTERSFYIQNGYEYWPFKGEYWLDEIGNYHFVGVRACE